MNNNTNNSTTANTPKKVCVAYSGGLDTSCIIPWLRETYGCTVVACVADVGQGQRELDGIGEKATKTGASECIIVDLKETFLREFAFPMAIAGSVYENRYLMGTSIARPIIARAQVEVALATGSDALCHGCTGKGNDQVRFESTYAALAPQLRVISPWRIWDLKSREAMLTYLKARNITTTASAEKIYSRDANIWHISHEGGELEDPWNAPPEDVWMITTSPKDAPDRHEDVAIVFKKGYPVSVNGKELDAVALLTELNAIGARNGVGRIDICENRLVGMKSRGVYETPGGSILHYAHRQMESLTMDREVMHQRDALIPKYAELVYNGFWYAPERLALQAYVEESQKNVTGTVRVKLYKGGLYVAGRKSKFSMYNPHIATMEADPTKAYNQDDATGFIRLNGLRLRVNSTVNGAKNLKG